MLTLIAAQSLDGFIARPGQPGTAFCSDADAAFLRATLQRFDSLIMGRRTYETLRGRIQSSTTTQFLRKIITRTPEDYASETKPDLIEFSDAEPPQIMAELAQRGRRKTALLGGGEIYTQYLASRQVDEVWLTLEPKLFGGGTPLLTAPQELDFEFVASTQLSTHTLLLKYRPKDPA